LRLVDPPKAASPLPRAQVLVSRGPFTQADDEALMRAHSIDIIVSKNAGGAGAYSKITAARALGLPVIMIDRPAIPDRAEASTPAQVLKWLAHPGAVPSKTERGV